MPLGSACDRDVACHSGKCRGEIGALEAVCVQCKVDEHCPGDQFCEGNRLHREYGRCRAKVRQALQQLLTTYMAVIARSRPVACLCCCFTQKPCEIACTMKALYYCMPLYQQVMHESVSRSSTMSAAAQHSDWASAQHWHSL